MTNLNNMAHFVGSIPLNSSEEVFCSICDTLGSHVKRIPDGETGERTNWIFFQRKMLANHPAMEPDNSIPKFEFKQWDGKIIREVELLKIKDTIDLENLIFPIGYSEYAIESFKDFDRLQSDGKIPSDIKFQVSLPKDFAMSVELANGIFKNTRRSVEFIHLPGTYGQPGNKFYEPLKNLKMPENCEIYLGLLFFDDKDGDAARIAAARKVLPNFGISTVCGWGRANPERVPSLLNSHKVIFN